MRRVGFVPTIPTQEVGTAREGRDLAHPPVF